MCGVVRSVCFTSVLQTVLVLVNPDSALSRKREAEWLLEVSGRFLSSSQLCFLTWLLLLFCASLSYLAQPLKQNSVHLVPCLLSSRSPGQCFILQAFDDSFLLISNTIVISSSLWLLSIFIYTISQQHSLFSLVRFKAVKEFAQCHKVISSADISLCVFPLYLTVPTPLFSH